MTFQNEIIELGLASIHCRNHNKTTRMANRGRTLSFYFWHCQVNIYKKWTWFLHYLADKPKNYTCHSNEVLTEKLLAKARISLGKVFQIALKYNFGVWKPIQTLKTWLKTSIRASLVLWNVTSEVRMEARSEIYSKFCIEYGSEGSRHD